MFVDQNIIVEMKKCYLLLLFLSFMERHHFAFLRLRLRSLRRRLLIGRFLFTRLLKFAILLLDCPIALLLDGLAIFTTATRFLAGFTRTTTAFTTTFPALISIVTVFATT